MTRQWKVWTERVAMAIITLGIIMIVQGVFLDLFGAGFIVVIAGTLLFIIISHL
jgi:hypothetical protein